MKATEKYYWIKLSREEIEDVLSNLDQCESEGYLNFGDKAYSAMGKLKEVIDESH